MERIRAQLDTGANFPKLGRLFQHHDTEPLAHQGQSRRQPPDAAAGHQHRQPGGPITTCLRLHLRMRLRHACLLQNCMLIVCILMISVLN